MPFPFVNPGWLIGLSGGAAPIIIHLLNKQRYKRMWWAAMEFLRRAVEKRRRRLRIEQLLLLLLRTAILLLLALVLSRPFVGGSALDALTQSSILRVFVVDNSFSMGYDVGGGQTALERAKRAAAGLADRMRGQDASALILANDSALPVIDLPMSDKERVKAALARIERSDRGTDLVRAVETALKTVAQNDLPTNHVYLFTDLTQAGWRLSEAERLAALTQAVKACPRKTELVLIDVGVPDPANLAVVKVDHVEPIVATLMPTELAVEVANFSDATLRGVPLELLIDDRSAGSEVVDEIGPASTAAVKFIHTFQRAGFHEVKVRTRPDALAADDERRLALRVREGVKVLLVDGEPAAAGRDPETLFLARAMQPEPDAYLERRFVIDPVVVNEVQFQDEPLADYDLVVLANVAQVPADRVKALEDFVRRGGALMVFMGDLVSVDDYNHLFHKKGQGLLPVVLHAPIGNPLVQSIFVRPKVVDVTHPVMDSIVKYTSDSLANMRAYRYMAATANEKDPTATVLARFDDESGTPAIVESRFGRGRVCYVGTTADQAWNNFGPRFAFAIFVNDMTTSMVQGSGVGRNLLVGERFTRGVTPAEQQGAILLTAPRGEIEDLTPKGEVGLMHVQYDATDCAGTYALDFRAADQHDGFVVNLPTAESNLARTSEKELRDLLPKAENVTYEFQRADDAGAVLSRSAPLSEIWKTLALVLGALVCLESFLAWKFGKYR